MAKETVSATKNGGKGYAAKLQELFDAANQILSEAAAQGVFFELYAETFPGGDVATYSTLDDAPDRSASADHVSFIEIELSEAGEE
jgi:hypothetical protein